MDNARKEEARQEAIVVMGRQSGKNTIQERVNEMQSRYESRIKRQAEIIDTQKERILALEEENEELNKRLRDCGEYLGPSVERGGGTSVSRSRRW